MCLPSHFGKVSLSQHLQYTAFEPGSNFSCKHTHPFAQQRLLTKRLLTKRFALGSLSYTHTHTQTHKHSVSVLVPSLIVSNIHLHICNATIPLFNVFASCCAIHDTPPLCIHHSDVHPFRILPRINRFNDSFLQTTFIAFLQSGNSQPVWPLWENRDQFFCSRVRSTCAG